MPAQHVAADIQCIGSPRPPVQSITAGCNLRLVKALAEGLPILYKHVVKQVKYEQAGVSVTAGNTVIKGDTSGPSLCKSLSTTHSAYCLYIWVQKPRYRQEWSHAAALLLRLCNVLCFLFCVSFVCYALTAQAQCGMLCTMVHGLSGWRNYTLVSCCNASQAVQT